MISNANGVVGVGCFAGQPTLSRVLDRMMKAYSLGDWKDALSAYEKVSFENQRPNLSVFTRRQGKQSQKYTASLDELSRLRRSRLH